MTPIASIFPIVQIYNKVIADDGRAHAFICLTALLVAFLFIRTSARMTRRFTWWPGGVETKGATAAIVLCLTGSKKLARAERRFDDPSRRGARLSRWLENTVRGRPADPDIGASQGSD